MNNTDAEYFRLLNLILTQGRIKHNRTGIDTRGVFGAQARFNLDEGFPILTTKKVFFKAIVHELLWFIRGDTNIKYLVDNGVHIWDEWAYAKYKKGAFKDGDVKVACDDGITLFSQQEFIELIATNKTFAQQWGELGEGTYGGMWRAFPTNVIDYDCPVIDTNPPQYQYKTVDQLRKVIDKLKTNPDDRRMIVSAWHPYWVDHCALPPCHCLFHFNTEELTVDERWNILLKRDNGRSGWVKGYGPDDAVERTLNELNIPKRRVNLLLYQRSCDTFLGVPFNISSYALLLAMVAHCVNMEPGTFVHTYGDLHIYQNHTEQIKLQLTREPKALPRLVLNPTQRDLFAFNFDDIKLDGYDPHPAIKGEVAV